MTFLKQAIRPAPLSALGAALITAFVTGAWPIVGLGLGAAALITSLAYVNEREDASNKPALMSGVGAGSPTPDPSRLEPELRGQFLGLLKKKTQILETLSALGQNPIFQFNELSRQVNGLVESYYGLLLKIQKVKPFTSSALLESIEAEIKDIEKSIEAHDDEIIKQYLLMARDNKRDEHEKISELRTDRKRIMAQLVNVSTALQNIHVRLVQLSLSPDEFDNSSSREIADQIDELTGEIRASERIAKELQAVVGPRSIHA